MTDPEPLPPRPPAVSDGDIIDIPEPPVESLPLSTVPTSHDPWSRELELERLRHQHSLDIARMSQEAKESAHNRRKEVIDRVAGHILRAMVVGGGIALFPLHYPVVGGLLLGAGLDLLTRSELRNILTGAIQGYKTSKTTKRK